VRTKLLLDLLELTVKPVKLLRVIRASLPLKHRRTLAKKLRPFGTRPKALLMITMQTLCKKSARLLLFKKRQPMPQPLVAGGKGPEEFVQGYKSGGDGADREAIQQRMLYDKLGKEMLRKDREHDQNLKQIARTHETIGEKIYENWVAKNRIRAVDKAELGDYKEALATARQNE